MHFEIALTPNAGNSICTISHKCTPSKIPIVAYSFDCDNCSKDTVSDTTGTPSSFSSMYLFAKSRISSSEGYSSSHSFVFSQSLDKSNG